MALRNQPYFPLYVQDYLTDEKLNMCSWETQGIYIKILCVLHKQTEYGTILFKQTPKQKESTCLFFADVLIRNLPCQREDMLAALEELIYYEVLIITEDRLFQKRMVKDNAISEARSRAGKKGGGNPILFKQKDKQPFKQIDKQNTEYESEYESEYNNESKGVKGAPETEPEFFSFDELWDAYDKKIGDQDKLRSKWAKVSKTARQEIKQYLPRYKAAEPNKKYRKNLETFINNKGWKDEIIKREAPAGPFKKPTESVNKIWNK